jgi:hypothetical protein
LAAFTACEAEGISLYVANSPLMSWAYEVMSRRAFSAVIGVVEVVVAILIAARPFSPRACAVGSVLAVGMFLTTLSFLITTPGVWEASAGGFPALSRKPGQFLIKDLALLGISLVMFGSNRITTSAGVAALISVTALSFVLKAAAAPPATPTSLVEFTEDGNLKKPDGYRKWVYPNRRTATW